MIFSTNTLISTKENISQTNEKINFSDFENFSFFLESLDMILEDQKIIRSIFVESYNKEIIFNEKLDAITILSTIIKKINFKKIISSIFKKFIELLERIWNFFHAGLLNFIRDDKVIKHYKSKIMNLNIPVKFNEERYIFTNLGLSTSYTSFKNELEKEYTTLILDLSKFINFKTYEGLYREIESMKENIDSSENYFDELRGKIVGSYNPVPSQEFATELYKYFRNNGNAIASGIILPNELKSICNSYFNYSTDLKKIKKDKSDLKDTTKKIEKDILKVKLEDYIKDNIPQDAQKMFISLLKNKVTRLNLICNLYIQVFSSKLDALKDSYVQNKKILMVASKKIVKEGL